MNKVHLYNIIKTNLKQNKIGYLFIKIVYHKINNYELLT